MQWVFASAIRARRKIASRVVQRGELASCQDVRQNHSFSLATRRKEEARHWVLRRRSRRYCLYGKTRAKRGSVTNSAESWMDEASKLVMNGLDLKKSCIEWMVGQGRTRSSPKIRTLVARLYIRASSCACFSHSSSPLN